VHYSVGYRTSDNRPSLLTASAFNELHVSPYTRQGGSWIYFLTAAIRNQCSYSVLPHVIQALSLSVKQNSREEWRLS